MAHPEDLHSKQRRRNLRTASPQGATMIGLLIGAAALGGGFVTTRNFVRRRLRFVDAVQRPAAPLLVGLAATAIALPIALLPVVTVRDRKRHTSELQSQSNLVCRLLL